MTRSTLTDMASVSQRSQRSQRKRPDIQGLRAIAVLAVVANHSTGFPGGGFVGVDIFFVVSGFVITLGLIRESEQAGSLSFRDFYVRRVARILPAAICTLVVTVIVSRFVFFEERADDVLEDAVWALFFSANWRFAVQGAGYWALDTPVSPLQHYWSLGVEEQFYLLWPLVLILVLGSAAAGKTPVTRRRYKLAAALAGIILLSFVWAMVETKNNAYWAYYSTASRAWELGVGALLAVAAPVFASMGGKSRLFFGWIGLAGIMASIAVIDKLYAIPAPWSALPVLSTAVVIAAGTGGSVRSFRFLTNPVTVYLGNASYSVYLWHFPVIVLLGTVWPVNDMTYYPLSIMVTGFLAVASYELVEMPAQRALTRMYGGQSWSRSHHAADSVERLRNVYLGLSALAVATAVVVPLSLRNAEPVEAPYAAAPAIPTENSSGPTIETNATRLASAINSALSATAWPKLTPSLDNLAAGFPVEDGEGCSDTDLVRPTCVFDEGKSATAVVYGDSTGVTFLATVRAAIKDQYNVRGITKAGCVVLDLDLKEDRQAFADECKAFKADAVAEINRIKPAVVLIINTAEALGRLSSGSAEAVAGPEWRSGTLSTLETLKPSGARLVIVTAPPPGKPMAKCALRNSTPRDCIYEIPQSFYITSTAMAEAAKVAGASFIDTHEWFCGASGYCPAFADGVVIKRDAVHTTKQYAAILAPVFRDALLERLAE